MSRVPMRFALAGVVAFGAVTLALPVSAASADAPAPSVSYFVIGDGSNLVGSSVTFWGAQWWKDNSLSGGSAPASFKGFADVVTFGSGCSGTFTAEPGDSSSPPDSVGPVIGVLVADSVTKDGSTISGTFQTLVNVETDPGYAPDPGHAGTGRDLGPACGGGSND